MHSDTSGEASAPRGADIRTFLFADVRGYTRYTREHGDEAASMLAATLADVVRAVVPKFHGDLFELRGDEAVSVFFSARAAIRAAVELQRRLREQREGEAGFPLGVGMGIDSGEAVPTEGGFRGGALNLAARLCAIAKPGQILVSDHAAHLAGRVDGARMVDRRPVRLKGMEKPVRLVEVVPAVPLPPLPTLDRARGRQRGLSTALLCAVLLATIAAVVAYVESARRTSTSVIIRQSSIAVIDTRSGRVLADHRIPIGASPVPLVAGQGALWTYNPGRKTLIRINPRTGAWQQEGVGVTPTDLAVGDGFIWLADGLGNNLYRVSWGTGSAPDRIRLPPSAVQPNYYAQERLSLSGQVTVFRSLVWATAQGVDWPQTIVAYNADSLRRTHLYRVPSATREIGDVESGPEGVWMENRIGGPESGRAALVRLAPSLGRPLYVSQGGYLQQGVAVANGSVWFAPGPGTGVSGRAVAKLVDFSTGSWVAVVAPAPITAIAAGRAGVWAAATAPGEVFHLGTRTHRASRPVELGHYVTGIAVGRNRVWALIQRVGVSQG